ncbi:MAG: DUF4184 family protein [Chitinivibrionales bacterium]|nr:DUF4184 family protein [Chitinivibrionales bacterium]
MPLTISHAATAIPLRRLRLPPSALIMGAMAPDFEFFLRLTDSRVFAHTIGGLFAFCLPLGLIGLCIFHKLLKYPLLSLLPERHQAKLSRPAAGFAFFPASRFFTVLLALFTGALSHLLWDAWTHHDGWFVLLFPLLAEPLFLIGAKVFHVYDILAHISSIAGIALLIRAYRQWYAQAPLITLKGKPRMPAPARIAVSTGIGAFSGISAFGYAFLTVPSYPPKPFIATALVSTVSFFLAIWLVFSCIWHVWNPSEESKA